MLNSNGRSVSTLSRRRVMGVIATAGAPLAASDSPDVESFDAAWRIVRDRHWDPKLNGVDWNAVGEEFRPGPEAARAEVRRRILAMLATLKQSHFGLIPSEVYALVSSKAGAAGAGVRLRVLEGEAVITEVRGTSPLRRGWIIRRAGEHDFKAMLARVAATNANPNSLPLLQTMSVSRYLQGEEQAELELECIDGDGKPVKHSIRLTKPPGKLAQFGLIPPTPVWLETSEPQPDVGVIRFNIFLDPPSIMEAFEAAVRKYRGMRGIILDLRGNPGGLGIMAMGMAGWFVRKEDLFLGTMILRESRLRFVVNPRSEVHDGPLAILMDPLSASTSEILGGGLRDIGRARIVGERSAGAALPSQFERLPNGDVLQFAFANYLSASGVGLEGRGVEPDIEAPPTRQALLSGRDNALEAAIHWIQNERTESK